MNTYHSAAYCLSGTFYPVYKMMQDHDIDEKPSVVKRGLCHAYKSKKSTSLLTMAAKKQLENVIYGTSSELPSRKGRQIMKQKNKKMSSISDVFPSKHAICTSTLESKSHFFKTGIDDPIFDHLVTKWEDPFIVLNVHETMDVIDDYDGCKMMEDDVVPIFILVPRAMAVRSAGNKLRDIEALTSILHGVKQTVRSSKRGGVCTAYATIGAHAQRGWNGVKEKKIKKWNERDHNQMRKMMVRAEHAARSVVPFGLMNGLKKARELVPYSCLSAKQEVNQPANKKETEIWASIATSFNYVSASHIDKDFFLSSLTVSTLGGSNLGAGSTYSMNMPVAVYFVFPEHGVAVALRPGDQLIFNPRHHHCVSMREVAYSEEEVYVTSFYLTTAVIGGNDNSQELTNLQKAMLTKTI